MAKPAETEECREKLVHQSKDLNHNSGLTGEEGGEAPCGVAKRAFRKALEYSAESTRVLAAEYADALRTTPRDFAGKESERHGTKKQTSNQFQTSSTCHPKIIGGQWCDALMPFHKHCPIVVAERTQEGKALKRLPLNRSRQSALAEAKLPTISIKH